MRTVTYAIAFCCLLCVPLSGPSYAAGPIDGEVSAVWWANSYDSDVQGSEASGSAGAAGLRAQLWMLNRYGLVANRFGSSPDETDGADYTSVDFMWRALSPTENNFVAVGVGWQQMEIAGLDQDTSGARLSVEGRFGLLGALYGYGHGAYLPALDDSDAEDPLLGRYADMDSYEYELGVAWHAMPFVNVHAGYRVNNTSFTHELVSTAGAPGQLITTAGAGAMTTLQEGGPAASCDGCAPMATSSDSGQVESSGFFVGVGISF